MHGFMGFKSLIQGLRCRGLGVYGLEMFISVVNSEGFKGLDVINFELEGFRGLRFSNSDFKIQCRGLGPKILLSK